MDKRSIGLSFVFFAYTLFIAFRGQWQASDIVWSMWIASLVSGYAYLLIAIFFGQKQDTPSKTLFLLLFFSVHFIGFHFVHGQIMQDFFPLREGGSGLSFVEQVRSTVHQYWSFILIAVVNMWPMFLELKGSSESNTRQKINFSAPYKAVMRNHFMIILIAIAGQFVSQPQMLYVLLFFYFFPFSELRQLFSDNKIIR